MRRRPVSVALVHHPVLDKRGDVVTTAVTNLDVHDIARTARTYELDRFYVVTPVVEQQRLVARLLQHWREGFGASYNPDRGEALRLVETVPTLEAARFHWQRSAGEEVQLLLTGAGLADGMPFPTARRLLRETPVMLVLGTGWGLAPELFTPGMKVLAAVAGGGDYNHLSVRAAAAIILDRLLGNREE
jgi:hypothetical protein